MLYAGHGSRFLFRVDNFGANPGATPGTSVVPGASNVEGTWTAVLSALAQDVYGVFLRVSDGATSTASKPQILDLGADPAGGTAYTAILSNLVCGATAAVTAAGAGHRYYFPIFIKSGSTVAVRIQGANATPGTVRVGIKAYGKPTKPEALPVGRYSETIGTITNSSGVSFTPGNAADGAWTSLGTTVKPLWWWQIGYQVENGTITAEYTYIELAYGDGTNKHTICTVMHAGTTGETCGTPLETQLIEGYCPVPAGATMYVRGRCLNAPDTGYTAVAVGIGG